MVAAKVTEGLVSHWSRVTNQWFVLVRKSGELTFSVGVWAHFTFLPA